MTAEHIIWSDGSSSPVVEPELEHVRSYNGRGNVRVLEHQANGNRESAALLVDERFPVYQRFVSEPHEPGRAYWFYREDLWILNQWGENLRKFSPRAVRRFLHRRFESHLHLPDGFENSAAPVVIEPNPFCPDQTQIYIGQAIQITQTRGRGEDLHLIHRQELISR